MTSKSERFSPKIIVNILFTCFVEINIRLFKLNYLGCFFHWTKSIDRIEKQESIPMGCIPCACVDRNCFNSHQMSVLVGPELNKFE